MEVDVLGIDLAKRVFQLHGATRTGAVLHRSKVSRPSLLEAIRRLNPKLVVMEACSSAHHWARTLQRHGVEARLISPQYVSPFVKTNKNDRNDAEAIVEAASRPAMRFVAVKSIEQQDLQALHRLRQLLVHQRTAIINQVRGVLAERGIVAPQSPAAFHRAMPGVLSGDDEEFSCFCRSLVVDLLEHLQSLEARISSCDAKVKAYMTRSEACKRIGAIDGVGPLTATAIVAAVGDAREFKNGRHLAAWLGLVPRQHSSGGQVQAVRNQQAWRLVPAHTVDSWRAFRPSLRRRQDGRPESVAAAAHRTPWLRPSHCSPGEQERTSDPGPALHRSAVRTSSCGLSRP